MTAEVKLAHVLHIENLVDIRQTVTILEQETDARLIGYKCSFSVVRDTFEAFELMAHKRFDCIIIDENVDFSAYEAIQTIRALIPDIPMLIILPTYNFEAALEDSGAAGCTHALERNYTSEQYCTALQSMLNMHQEQHHNIQNVTHFPWQKPHAPDAASFHHFPTPHSPVPAAHAGLPAAATIPGPAQALLSDPSDLLRSAMQFFNAQRLENNLQTRQAPLALQMHQHQQHRAPNRLQQHCVAPPDGKASANATFEDETSQLDSENFNAMLLFDVRDSHATV